MRKLVIVLVLVSPVWLATVVTLALEGELF